MRPGGTTEILWHFAGYLHFALEDLRARLNYEEGPPPAKPNDYVAKLPHYNFSPVFQTPGSEPIPPPDQWFGQGEWPARGVSTALGRRIASADKANPSPSDNDQPSGAASGGGGGKPMIKIVYGPGGNQTLSEINQLNMGSDDDQFGVAGEIDVDDIHDIDIAAALQEMEQAAAAEIPLEIAAPQIGVHAMAAFLQARDAATKAASEQADEQDEANESNEGDPSIVPGLYIDGDLQAKGSTRPTDPIAEEEPANLDAKGQWATLGGNIATNAALIVDLNEAAPSLMVLGDYFHTKGIVQTNLFVDNDQAHFGPLSPREIATSGNTATNIAEFIQHGGIHGAAAGKFGGPLWNVHVVEGDFFDINLLTQKNYLHDNDVTAQDSLSTHFQLIGGENGQYNLARFLKEMSKYDMIVVGGDYHGANLVFQTNILLDNDILKLVLGADHPTGQFALTGQNALLNDVTIVTYGNNAFQSFTDDLNDLASALVNRETAIDMGYGKLIPGDGTGVLDILYVTGDYYDINALWQINVIADLDLALQLLASTPPDVPRITGGEFTQSATTGGNELTNLAGIVDVGSTFGFLKGEMYEDSILVQTNLVTDDDDEIAHHDVDELVSEVIAFIGSSEPEDDAGPNAQPSFHPQDDVMGSVLT